jgi:hypothetical protein
MISASMYSRTSTTIQSLDTSDRTKQSSLYTESMSGPDSETLSSHSASPVRLVSDPNPSVINHTDFSSNSLSRRSHGIPSPWTSSRSSSHPPVTTPSSLLLTVYLSKGYSFQLRLTSLPPCSLNSLSSTSSRSMESPLM